LTQNPTNSMNSTNAMNGFCLSGLWTLDCEPRLSEHYEPNELHERYELVLVSILWTADHGLRTMDCGLWTPSCRSSMNSMNPTNAMNWFGFSGLRTMDYGQPFDVSLRTPQTQRTQ